MFVQNQMLEPLSFHSFFSHYMFHPSAAPTPREQRISWVASVVLGVFGALLVHAFCYCFLYNKKFTKQMPSSVVLDKKIEKIAEKENQKEPAPLPSQDALEFSTAPLFLPKNDSPSIRRKEINKSASLPDIKEVDKETKLINPTNTKDKKPLKKSKFKRFFSNLIHHTTKVEKK